LSQLRPHPRHTLFPYTTLFRSKRRTVQLTVWVEPIVKAEVQRRAKRDDLSDSAVGAALLKKGMQTDLDMEYGALLTPVFENILRSEEHTSELQSLAYLVCRLLL